MSGLHAVLQGDLMERRGRVGALRDAWPVKTHPKVVGCKKVSSMRRASTSRRPRAAPLSNRRPSI
jgi:hypothetical protein